MKDCVFCRIVKGKEDAKVVKETENLVVIHDINPQAAVHLLIIPKKHIVSVAHLEEQDKELMGELILTAQKIAKDKGLKGYKLAINVGREGGQIIDHIHLHLLGK